jgi:hypothetical protein
MLVIPDGAGNIGHAHDYTRVQIARVVDTDQTKTRPDAATPTEPFQPEAVLA